MTLHRSAQVLISLLFVCLAARLPAHVWIDESFDDGVAFNSEDLDVYNNAPPPDPPLEFRVLTGEISSQRAYNGEWSWRMDPGDGLAVDAGHFDGSAAGPFQYLQLALSVGAIPATPGSLGELRYELDVGETGGTTHSLFVNVRSNGTIVEIVAGEDQATATETVIGELATVDEWIHLTLQLQKNSSQETDTRTGQTLSQGFRFHSSQNGYLEVPLDEPLSGIACRGWNIDAVSAPLFMDDLYWEGAMTGGSREELSALREFPLPRDPGIDSPIRTIFVVGHTHLDIGFTDPPATVANRHKMFLDGQIAYARTRPDYKWTIESTWTLEEWMARSGQEQVTEFMEMVLNGKMAVTAGHSSAHSAKLGFEELNRLLWNAKRYRESYGIEINTLMHDDVPGLTWSYVQVLAKSGIRYLVCGNNLFIGGGFEQPYESYLFRWRGPDGSSVLTWVTQNSYAEGHAQYGLPWISNDPVNQTSLEEALANLEADGYPWDALMIQQAFDNASIRVHYNAITEWNATHQNPQFILATPEDFFEYMEERYGDEIAEHSGNWTTRWDAGQMAEPKSEVIVRQAERDLPAGEQMGAIASVAGWDDYPHQTIDVAWERMLTVDEHSGGGAWPGYFTAQEAYDNNLQHYQFALDAEENTRAASDAIRPPFLSLTALPDEDTVVVYNPLSWERTGPVRLRVPSWPQEGRSGIVDAVSGEIVETQYLGETEELVWIADAVPAMGFRRYRFTDEPPASPTAFKGGEDPDLENEHYRIEFLETGLPASIVHKSTGRELLDAADDSEFNGMRVGTTSEYFLGSGNEVSFPPAQEVERIHAGPVLHGTRASHTDHPLMRTEVLLYDGIDRVDIVNRVDSREFLEAPIEINSMYYGFTFPFELESPAARIETALGWLDPAQDSLPSSYRGAHVVQCGLDLSEPGFGVTFVPQDVYTHSFGGFQTAWNETGPVDPTVVSTFTRYIDEIELTGGEIGPNTPEPGSSPWWDLRYSIRAHDRGFDAVEEVRFVREAACPLLAAVAPGGNGILRAGALSFFSVSDPGVIVAHLKQAADGDGLIMKVLEVAGDGHDEVEVRSGAFRFLDVEDLSPLEEIPDDPGQAPQIIDRALRFDIGEHEFRVFRIRADLLSGDVWVLNGLP